MLLVQGCLARPCFAARWRAAIGIAGFLAFACGGAASTASPASPSDAERASGTPDGEDRNGLTPESERDLRETNASSESSLEGIPPSGAVGPFESELAAGDTELGRDAPDAALEHYQKALALVPDSPDAALGVLRVKFAKLGLLAYREAPHHPEVERLLGAVDGILTAHPEHAAALLERGRMLLVLGDASGALASLDQSVVNDGQVAEGHSALGVAYLATGEVQKALDQFEVALRLEPDEPERMTNLATTYMLRGRVSEAIATYERALALRPDDARTHGDLGAAYLADNRPDIALPHLERATRLAPERATFLTNLGYAYQRHGQLDKAVETQRRAIALDPKLGSAWINLGNALAEQRHYEQAEAALRQAEALDPNDPRPKASLRDLAELRAREPKGVRGGP